jgi:2,3-bisphosphoglycerate-dependent phosphoglycerate mutase
LRDVQQRNVGALNALLETYAGRTVAVGTHGTALATILNHFDQSFGAEDFLEMIDLMPCVIKMTFEGRKLTGKDMPFKIRRPF